MESVGPFPLMSCNKLQHMISLIARCGCSSKCWSEAAYWLLPSVTSTAPPPARITPGCWRIAAVKPFESWQVTVWNVVALSGLVIKANRRVSSLYFHSCNGKHEHLVLAQRDPTGYGFFNWGCGTQVFHLQQQGISPSFSSGELDLWLDLSHVRLQLTTFLLLTNLQIIFFN